jgi:hypothetical protein
VEEISLEPGAITSAIRKVPPQKDLQNHAHFEKSGDVGDSGDIFRLPWKGYTIYLWNVKSSILTLSFMLMKNSIISSLYF